MMVVLRLKYMFRICLSIYIFYNLQFCCQEIFDHIIKKVSEVEETLTRYQDYLSHLKMFEVASVYDSQYDPNTEGVRYMYIVFQSSS